MDDKFHFIWGSPSLRKKRIQLLKINGMKKIYILSKDQKLYLKEKKEVTYLPAEFKSFIKMDNVNIVHHFFLRIPSKSENRNKEQ